MSSVSGVRSIKVGFYMFFPGGGIGRYTHELASTMQRREDADVEVICSPDFEWKDTTQYPTWPGLKSISHSNALVRRSLFLRGQFVNPLKCIYHARDRGMDVIHFSNINHLTFPFWRPALKGSGMRVAATAHDVRRQKSMISRSWEDAQLKAFYRYADVLFVHSSYQLEDLVDFAEVERSKVKVVPHGLYPHGEASNNADEYEQIARQKPGRRALFFGQIRDEKNLDGLIRALSLCDTEIHLIVAGRSTSKHRGVDYYRDLAAEHGVDDRVTFLSRYIPDDEVGALFDAADWVALPYLHTFTSQSGVLNTAAYYDKPVLVSGAPVLRETVETCDIGISCEGDAPEDVAEGIDRMENRLVSGHVHAFEEYRRRYSWRENARAAVEVYREVANLPAACKQA